MFKTNHDRLCNIISEEYESWIVHDQELFTWFLSKISNVVLPRVLSCKHALEIWDKVHKHFRAQMKAIVHQLCVELRMNKKGNKTIYAYILRIREVSNSFLPISDLISERDQVNAILLGLPKEYNMFNMMIYDKAEPTYIYEVEALIYVQKAQMGRYHQELTTSSATTNIANA